MPNFNDEDVQAVLSQVQRARLNDRRAMRDERLFYQVFLAAILMLQVSTILQIRAIPAQCDPPSVLGVD